MNIYVSSGVVSRGRLVTSGNSMYISSGGTANSTTTNSGGAMSVSSGGVANDTMVSNGGYMFVSSGGVTNRTAVYSGGFMYVSSGGVANDTMVSNGGYMFVYSGSTATDIIAESGAILEIIVASNTYIQGTSAGSAFEMKDATISNYTVNTRGFMYVYSGGTANSTTVNTRGYIFVSNGGTANSTTVNSGGYIFVSSGGVANDTMVSNGGYMFVYSGSTATDIIAESGAILKIIVASNTYIQGTSAGSAFEMKDATISNYTVNTRGFMSVSNGGVANDTMVSNGGMMYVKSGGTANSTTVNSSGSMYVSSGGTASIVFNPWQGTIYSPAGASVTYLKRDANVYYGGYVAGLISKYNTLSDFVISSGYSAIVYSGGTANSTTVNSGGDMSVNSGGMITGELKIKSGAKVSVYSGAIIDFTVAEQTETAVPLIQNWNLISNANQATYTCTINADQGPGTYSLASNADTFEQTVTVKNTDGVELGTISLTDTFTQNGLQYALALNESVLNLIITDIEKPSIASVSEPPWSKESVNIVLTANDNVGVTGYAVTTGNSSTDAVWQTSNTFKITEDGTYYFWAKDEAGNISEAKSVTIDKVDNTAPTISISGNATEWTNQDVTITATGSDSASGIAKTEYNDGSGWKTGDTVTLSANGSVQFRVVDNAGNVTTETITIIKIDKDAPTISITGNPETWTNQDVTITATGSDSASGVAKTEYNDGSGWKTGDTVTLSANGSVQFRVVDNAGNVTTETITIIKIDKDAPTISITGNPETWTNQDVTITATGSDSASGVAKMEYNVGSGWKTGDTVILSANGSVQFRVIDNAGNVTTETVTVNKIDKDAPTIAISGNAEGWTNQDVTIIATGADSASGVAKTEYNVGSGWKTGDTVTLSANGSVQFRVIDNAGNVTTETVTVDKIDKNVPTINITGNPETWTNQDVTITATGSDSASGVAKMEYNVGSGWKTGDTVTLSANGSVQFRVIDNAGNVTTENVTVNKIDKNVPTINISGNATEWTNQDVTITATGSDSASGVAKMEYNVGSGWKTGDTVILSANGSVQFRVVDNAGNVTTENVTVNKIDKNVPTINISGNATEWTKDNVTLKATGADSASGVAKMEYNNGSGWKTGDTVTLSANGSVQFRVIDNAGNVTTETITIIKIDKDAPTISISGNPETWTNQDVTITATGSDSASGIAKMEYSLDGNVWTVGDSCKFEQSGTIHFRATDNAGNIASETVEAKIDMSAPIVKVTDITDGKITADFADIGGFAVKLYSLNNGGTWQEYTESVTVEAGKIVLFKAVDNAGNESEILRFDTAVPLNDVKIDEPTDVKLTTGVTGSILLKATGNITIISGQEIKYEAGKVTENVAVLPQIEPKILTAVEDGAADIFLARKYDTWRSGEYVARHTGIKDAAGSWFGTREAVALDGKNKIADVFYGCEDANILYLTDDANGDALFVDDIYTENPGGGARIAKIDEIRAGDGDDVVDFTSQRFDYDGDGVIIRGGLGDDTIWSNNGENFLFGDEGNDRIVGGSDNDVIVGGIGDDSMQGGGGDDIFCFGGNWGNDVVEQLSNGSVIIWFGDSIVESDLTIKSFGQHTKITCGDNSILVKDLGPSRIELKFGGEADYESLASIGAFSDYTSKKIFEDNAEDKNLVIAVL